MGLIEAVYRVLAVAAATPLQRLIKFSCGEIAVAPSNYGGVLPAKCRALVDGINLLVAVWRGKAAQWSEAHKSVSKMHRVFKRILSAPTN